MFLIASSIQKKSLIGSVDSNTESLYVLAAWIAHASTVLNHTRHQVIKIQLNVTHLFIIS